MRSWIWVQNTQTHSLDTLLCWVKAGSLRNQVVFLINAVKAFAHLLSQGLRLWRSETVNFGREVNLSKLSHSDEPHQPVMAAQKGSARPQFDSNSWPTRHRCLSSPRLVWPATQNIKKSRKWRKKLEAVCLFVFSTGLVNGQLKYKDHNKYPTWQVCNAEMFPAIIKPLQIIDFWCL